MRRVKKQEFAARVRARLNAVGLNASELARTLGLKQQTVDNVVQGKVERPRFIAEMAEALSTTSNWLLFGDGQAEARRPFDPEEVLKLIKSLSEEQRAAGIMFLRTLAEKSEKAA